MDTGLFHTPKVVKNVKVRKAKIADLRGAGTKYYMYVGSKKAPLIYDQLKEFVIRQRLIEGTNTGSGKVKREETESEYKDYKRYLQKMVFEGKIFVKC